MTVPFVRIEPAPAERSLTTYRNDPEPALVDLLGDPTLHTLMARDGVDRASLECLLALTQQRLGLRLPPPPRPAFEAAQFAECG
jgi:hypothetical protein